MSYSRFSRGCDVYVYPDVNGDMAYCACGLDPVEPDSGEWYFTTFTSLKAHLERHIAAGHQVPGYPESTDCWRSERHQVGVITSPTT